MHFKTKQNQFALSSNIFNAEEARIYSIAELSNLWEPVFFTKHSDTTLKFLGKAIPSDFLTTPGETSNWFLFNSWKKPVLSLQCFKGRPTCSPSKHCSWVCSLLVCWCVFAVFGFGYHILTQCDVYFSTFLFLQFVLTFLLKSYMSISKKYRLHWNITTLSSLAHGFLAYTISKVVTDLHDAKRDKRQRRTFRSPDDPPDYSLQRNIWKTQTNSVNKKPEFTPQVFTIKEPSRSIIFDKCQIKITKPE